MVMGSCYSGDASGGALTVTDGSHSANIALLGNYLASTFVPTSDGHGGTNVIDPPVIGGVHRSSPRRTPDLPPQWWHQFSVKSGRPGT